MAKSRLQEIGLGRAGKPMSDAAHKAIVGADGLSVMQSVEGAAPQASPIDQVAPFKPAEDFGKSRGPRSPWKTRYFIDTEFTDFKDCQLISIAIVGEDGCEFYGECTDFDLSLCNDFVRCVVLPQVGQFPGRSMTSTELRDELRVWLTAVPLKPKPVLCYDSDCDLELVTHLLGGPLPHGWRHENVFLKIDAERFARYIAIHGGEHHALHDARANAFAFR